MGSSVLLVLLVPLMIIDFIDSHFGTNLAASLSDIFSNAIDYFVESGMSDKLADVLTEIFEKWNMV